MATISVLKDARQPTVLIFDVSGQGKAKMPQALPTHDNLSGRFMVNSWSLDGDRLAGQLEREGNGIAMYSFSSRRYELLADFGEWPVWMPDSRRA